MSRVAGLQAEIRQLEEKKKKIEEIKALTKEVIGNIDPFISSFKNVSTYFDKIQLSGKPYDEGAFEISSDGLKTVKNDINTLENKCLSKIAQINERIKQLRKQIERILEEERQAALAAAAAAAAHSNYYTNSTSSVSSRPSTVNRAARL